MYKADHYKFYVCAIPLKQKLKSVKQAIIVHFGTYDNINFILEHRNQIPATD